MSVTSWRNKDVTLPHGFMGPLNFVDSKPGILDLDSLVSMPTPYQPPHLVGPRALLTSLLVEGVFPASLIPTALHWGGAPSFLTSWPPLHLQSCFTSSVLHPEPSSQNANLTISPFALNLMTPYFLYGKISRPLRSTKTLIQLHLISQYSKSP